MNNPSNWGNLWKVAFRFFLNQALFVLSYLIPHRKGLVIIGAGFGKRFMGNPKYLYLGLLNRQRGKCQHPIDLDFFWITENEEIYEEFRQRNWPVLRKFSLAGFWKLLRAEFLVIESGMMSTAVAHDVAYAWLFWGRFNVVQTWHGTALKLICLDSLRARGLNNIVERLFYLATLIEYRSYDCVIAQSDHDRKVFTSAFAASNVPVLGSPRNDVLLNPSIAYKNTDTLLGLSNFKRVILYAPTYRESRDPHSDVFRFYDKPLKPFSNQYISNLNDILAERDWLLLVKKHHFDRALVIQENLNNVREVNDIEDIQDLLIHTDMLITDYSSVFFDYLQAGLPIIYYVYDLENYTSMRGFYMEYSENIIGPFATNEHDLTRLIIESEEWFNDCEYQEKFQKFRSTYQKFTDGRATDRLINYLQLRSAGINPRQAGKDAEQLSSSLEEGPRDV